MKSLLFVLIICGLVACKNKNGDIYPTETVYPAQVFLTGNCGKEIALKWTLYKPKPCGFECFDNPVVYEYFKPDYYEIYASSDKTNLKSLKQVSGSIDSTVIVLDKKTSYYVQIKAVYLKNKVEVTSSIIMVSSDDLPQPQEFILSNQYATFDLQGVKYESNLYSPILEKNQNLVIHNGTNNKDSWANWIQNISTGKQVFIWKNPYPSWGEISPDGKKAIMAKMDQIQGRDVQDLFLFDIDTQKITQITNLGSRYYSFFWSPNSQTIAVEYFDYNADKTTLATIDLTTKKLNKIENNGPYKLGRTRLLGWLKDNTIRLIEASGFSTNYISNANLYNLNMVNGNIDKIAELEIVGIWYEYSFKYNENGTKLAFTSRRSGKDAIWIKDLVTGRIYAIGNNINTSGVISGWKSDKEIVYRTVVNNTDKHYLLTLE